MSITSNPHLGTEVKKTIEQVASNNVLLNPAATGPSYVSVRVLAGAAAVGPRLVTDSGGTPDASTATLSDDGKTLTFEGDVTQVELKYTSHAITTGIGS